MTTTLAMATWALRRHAPFSGHGGAGASAPRAVVWPVAPASPPSDSYCSLVPHTLRDVETQTFLPAQMAFDTAPISSTPIADTIAEHPITWTKPVYAGSVKQFSVPGPLVFHMGAEPTELDRLCPPSQTTGSRQIGCSSLRPVASEPRSGALARDIIWQWACSVARESESLRKRRSDSDSDSEN